MKIGIIGTGRWGSNIAGLLTKNGHEVLAWEKVFEGSTESEFYRTKKNSYIDLSNANITFTHDLNKTLNFGELVFISILSQSVDELMGQVEKIPGYADKKYVLAMKGIEQTTGRTLSEILRDHGVKNQNICVIAGPGHVQSIVAGELTHMVVAGYDAALAAQVAQILSNRTFKLFQSYDVNGVEICGAAKNVYGGLGGMCVGAKNDTLRGSLMCASLVEMERYLEAMGCLPKTARGLALLGDYDATMYDQNSHNFTFGIAVVEQNTPNPQLPFVSIEGKQAVSGLIRRMINYNNSVSDKMQLKAPLLTTYHDIVNGKIAPSKAVDNIEDAIEQVYEMDKIL